LSDLCFLGSDETGLGDGSAEVFDSFIIPPAIVEPEQLPTGGVSSSDV
jgi:hypothetical protein